MNEIDGNTVPPAKPGAISGEPSSTESGIDANPGHLRAHVYIELPTLSAEERKKFIPANLSDSDSEDITLEEVVGEYDLGSERYLYARWSDGVYRKKRAWEVKATHPDLYDDYEERKKAGTLDYFDPSAISVHPRDRVEFLLHIDRQRLGQTHTRHKRRARGSSSSLTTLSSDESEDQYGSEDEDEDSAAPRRNARRRVRDANGTRDLPFSPRRTRALGRISRKTRRSSDSDFDESLDDTSGSDVSFQKPKTKRVPRKVYPLYGQIENVEDLWDPSDDSAPLRAHRAVCEKCRRAPAHILLNEERKKRKKPPKHREEDYIDEVQHTQDLGGWVQCLRCCVALHWKCLAKTERDDILRAIRQKDADLLEGGQDPKKRTGLIVEESTSYICGWCSKAGKCLGCGETVMNPKLALESHQSLEQLPALVQSSPVDSSELTGSTGDGPYKELLFRCNTCKRLAHYDHLDGPEGEDISLSDKARYYQEEQGWLCADCSSYTYSLDKILAWRPSSDAFHSSSPYLDSVDYRDDLPREYLVKWTDRSYKRTTWVPHMWLLSTYPQKLKNFVLSGSIVEFGPAVDNPNIKDVGAGITQTQSPPKSPSTRMSTKVPPHSLAPLLDAQERIPSAWKTVDRVLDILLWCPQKRFGGSKNRNRKYRGRRALRSPSLSSSPEVEDPGFLEQYQQIFDVGDQPNDNLTETVDEWENRTGKTFSIKQIHLVVWALLKWEELPYNEVTWDSPPQSGDPGFAAFESALSRFIRSRDVLIYIKSNAQTLLYESRGGTKWKPSILGIPDDNSYDIGQDKSLTLMDFQVTGVNWLCKNWFRHQQCILADEMGLGKTVQIVTFIGLLLEKSSAFPSLVVVPNSTITNWVREFERWAPKLRVCPFYGDAKARDIIKRYELFHQNTAPGTTGGMFHVLVTTYETVINTREFNAVFKRVPRWELLVVDEGQRLKNDSSLLFKKLNELNTVHRIIMTGTPLNNNIRELFNLMNFLDPDEWDDLRALEKQHEELTEELVKELHEKLRPYFLRRTKGEVLKLPPKNEVIVPLSMAPLQKEIYKSILSQNLEILRSFTQISFKQHRSSAIAKSTTSNMLMQLRKTLQHPYLVADDIEPKGLSQAESHVKLIDASSKLQFLKLLLPKLRFRGHRVLLFSQFVIALDIIEDFLVEENFKFLRLDGNTKQSDRQARMDEFNREKSDVFIFILSTRAGGVGINLWSADTVIIFDPDFNPHQDLQAIARAHRFGQQKPCLVFKLMVKESAEDKIMQMGKRKLVLDHLIVQKMDDEDTPEDIQSILTFGAQALFQENSTSKDITYSDQDVDQLIDKLEKDEPTQDVDGEKPSFSFAKIWHAEIDNMEDFSETTGTPQNESDSWAQTLDKIAAERAKTKAVEVSGRGARRKATEVKVTYYEPSPEKAKKKRRTYSASSLASDIDYIAPENPNSDSDSSSYTASDITKPGRGDILPDLDLHRTHLDASSSNQITVIQEGFTFETNVSTVPNINEPPVTAIERHRASGTSSLEWGSCGLCGTNHPDGQCDMTRDSDNLSEYRKILMENKDEPWEIRKRAIAAIDATLKERDRLSLTSGQAMFKPRPSHKIKTNKKSRKRHDPLPMQPATTFSGLVNGRNDLTDSHATVSGSQKRDYDTLISSVDDPPTKKIKPLLNCEICHNSPYHIPEQCPRVQGDVSSLITVIMKLQSKGGRKETIVALRELIRQRKAEAANANAPAEPIQKLS